MTTTAEYKEDYGLKHSAKDIYGVPLVMPTEISKLINEFARVKVPQIPMGEHTGVCAICFNKRPDCNKVTRYRYCKGCYQEYTSNGGFNWENTYEETMVCVKCENPKREGYKNTPLCIPCFDYEKKRIYQYQGKTFCGCGNRKALHFPFCKDCNQKGEYTEAKRKLDVRLCEIIQNFNSDRFQLDDE